MHVSVVSVIGASEHCREIRGGVTIDWESAWLFTRPCPYLQIAKRQRFACAPMEVSWIAA